VFQSFVSFQHKIKSSPEVAQTKRKISFNPRHLNLKVKSILGFGILVIVLISIFAVIPRGEQKTISSPQNTDSPLSLPSTTPQATDAQTQSHNVLSDLADTITNLVQPPGPPDIFESSKTMNSTVWRQVAAYSWQYFAPGVGVDSNSGLPKSGVNAPYFTDWDLGVYIQAVIDAKTIGVLDESGKWGSSARLETAVSFLENRPINETTGYPYWFYRSYDGKDHELISNLTNSPYNVIDTGRLLVALNNLRAFNSTLAPRINAFVIGPGNRSNYAAILADINTDSFSSRSIYAYYNAVGFASFWPSLASVPDRILSNMYSAGNITYDGVTLPLGEISCEPLLSALFDSANNTNNTKLLALAQQVYSAHEAYFNDTGNYRAFGEGSSPTSDWIYETVILPNGRMWIVTFGDGSEASIYPVIYTKTAVSFLALSNSPFAKSMIIYLDKNLPNNSSGFYEGVDENGEPIKNLGIHTNGMIISAANYAIQHQPLS
jgi:hypothetical protein